MRTTRKERLGYWLIGAVIATIVGAVVAVATWSELRTVQETMEGGWTRNVIDDTVAYLPIFGWATGACLLAWTVVWLGYWMIEDNS